MAYQNVVNKLKFGNSPSTFIFEDQLARTQIDNLSGVIDTKIQAVQINKQSVQIINKTAILSGIALTGWVQENFINKSEIINVKDFGAKGDNISNDSVCFQNAINAAAYKTLYIPSGNYLVSSLNIQFPMQIIGVQKQISVLRAISENSNIFNVNLQNQNSILIQNICFTPRIMNNNYIVMNNVPFIKVENKQNNLNKNSIIRNCMFISGKYGIIANNTAHLTIENCKFYSNKVSVCFNSTINQSEKSIVDKCLFVNSELNSESIGILQYSCSGLKVLNNEFVGQKYCYVGQFKTSNKNLLISGNSFEKFQTSAIKFQPYENENAVIRSPLKSIIITNNQFNFVNKNNDSSEKYGIFVKNSQNLSGTFSDYLLSDLIISNNQFSLSSSENINSHCIFLNSTINSFIERNLFFHLTNKIIQINPDCFNIDVYHQGGEMQQISGQLQYIDSKNFMTLNGNFIHQYNFMDIVKILND